MAPSTQLAALVNELPDPDDRGMYCTGIDKEKIEKTIGRIHEGGQESLLGLIDMLVPPGEGNDVKAHYALHCLAIHVGKPEDPRQRREFSATLASQLGGPRPKAVRAYLIQELQLTGGKEVAPDLGKLLHDEDLCDPATRALLAIREGAAEQFCVGLAGAKGRCRLAILLALGQLQDESSAEAMRKAIKDEDPEIRMAAGWGLANIGDAASVDLLIAASQTDGWERIRQAKACLLLAERLKAAGKASEAKRIWDHLKKTRTEPTERYLQDAAAQGEREKAT